MRGIALIVLAAALTACAAPKWEEPMPTSPEAWQRRQESIERQRAERERLCRITKDEDPRKPELCRGVERENR